MRGDPKPEKGAQAIQRRGAQKCPGARTSQRNQESRNAVATGLEEVPSGATKTPHAHKARRVTAAGGIEVEPNGGGPRALVAQATGARAQQKSPEKG